MKLTYSEQLRHPNWQRVRLKVLERAGFCCDICGNDEMTLNVHHKRYIKGRMAWEYDLEDFDALCEACHESTHQAKDSISAVLARIPSVRLQEVADMLMGWGEAWMIGSGVDVDSHHSYEIGRLAGLLDSAINYGAAVKVVDQLVAWDGKSELHLVIEKKYNPFADDEGFK